MLGIDTKPNLGAHHTLCYTTLNEMNTIQSEDYIVTKLARSRVHAHLLAHPHGPIDGSGGSPLSQPGTFAPYKLADWYWDDPREQYLENQLDLLEKKFGLEAIRDHITVANNRRISLGCPCTRRAQSTYCT